MICHQNNKGAKNESEMNKTFWAVLLKAAGPLAENRGFCRLRGDLNRNGVPRFCNTTSSLLAPLIPVCGLLYLAVTSCGRTFTSSDCAMPGHKKTIAARWSCFFNWCRRPDSNRHALRALDFESSASANSATSARVWCNEDILALKHHFVNGFPRFGVLQSERKFIGRVNTDWPADGDACQFSVFHGCLDGNGAARFLEDEGKRFLMTQA